MKKKHPASTGRSWEDQFFLSIKHWAELEADLKDPRDPNELAGSLDQRLESYFEEKDDRTRLLVAALRAMLHQQLDFVFRDVEVALSKCESPIEVAMLFALAIVGRELMDAVFYLVDGHEHGDRPSLDTLCIEPQAQLGEHRVDFLLTHRSLMPDFENKRKLPDGTEIPGTVLLQKKMVIECDGHDFHDRTKEQARKDRERDRALQSFGYRVYRYTGSEIWSDVFKCAHEAIVVLEKITHARGVE